jgi:hypothetical protein
MLQNKWVDSIGKSLGRMLDIDEKKVEEYAKDVLYINEKRKRRN